MTDKRRERTPHTSAELDQLAEISLDDIERAQQRFREVASPEFKDLLDAQPDEEK
jgi:tRNA uridine 5-carbamoylmethylation protein Kti12